MSLAGPFISLTKHPAKHLFCFPLHDPPEQSGSLFFLAYFYYFQIDRICRHSAHHSEQKLQEKTHFLSYILYHHAVVVIMSYMLLSTTMSLFLIALVTNAAVHVLIYGYDLLCAIGIRPRWILGVVCAGLWGWVFSALFNASLLYLFIDFHKRKYADMTKQKNAAAGKLSDMTFRAIEPLY